MLRRKQNIYFLDKDEIIKKFDSVVLSETKEKQTLRGGSVIEK